MEPDLMKGYLATLLLFTFLTGTAEAKIKVVASFSILADLTANVGGEKIELTSIVKPGSDAHVYEPKPDDVKAVAAADVVIVNGLGFEGWQQRLIEASGFKKSLVTAAEGIRARELEHEAGHQEHDEEAHAHDHQDHDPHAWQNVANAQVYVANIARGLCAADMVNCDYYEGNAKVYTERLVTLDSEIKSAINTIPEQNRTIITSHDAFGYLAEAYGLDFLAPEGISTDAEASAKDVAQLIVQVREKNAKALFVENISDPRLLEQIASETGLQPGGTLYSDALSRSDGPASTYIDMMRHNIKTITSAILTQ
jgi:zinc/manganese transport system substrate-binding protein